MSQRDIYTISLTNLITQIKDITPAQPVLGCWNLLPRQCLFVPTKVCLPLVEIFDGYLVLRPFYLSNKKSETPVGIDLATLGTEGKHAI